MTPGIPHLIEMPLANLDIRNTEMTQAAVKKLQQALPKCKIVHGAETNLIQP